MTPKFNSMQMALRPINNTVLGTLIEEDNTVQNGVYTGGETKRFQRMTVKYAENIEEGEVAVIMAGAGETVQTKEGPMHIINQSSILFFD